MWRSMFCPVRDGCIIIIIIISWPFVNFTGTSRWLHGTSRTAVFCIGGQQSRTKWSNKVYQQSLHHRRRCEILNMSEIFVFIKGLELTGMKYLVCLSFYILQVLRVGTFLHEWCRHVLTHLPISFTHFQTCSNGFETILQFGLIDFQ